MITDSAHDAVRSASPQAKMGLAAINITDGEDAALNVRENDAKMAVKRSESGENVHLQEPPLDHREHLASDERTFANSLIAFLGSGVLGLPYAFRRTGILLGLATLVVVAIVSTYAMLLIVQCKYKLKERGVTVTTYGDIGYHALGRPGRLLVNTAIVISQAGFCVAYLIFIITNGHQFLGIDKEVVVAVCVPPLIAFSMLKHMKELAFVALAADVMNFIGLAVVYAADLSFMASDHDRIETLGIMTSIPFFFGVASYCFEGVGMVLPLENGMQNPSHFKAILVCTVVIITTLYATFGVCGYLAFGDATKDVITLNMTDDSGFLSLVKLCLCAGLLFAYPLMMFPVFELLQPLVTSSNPETQGRVTDEQKMILVKSVVVFATAALAVCIPNFGQFISFIGATCCTMLAFIFPAAFHLLLFPLETKWYKAIVLATLIALGIVAVVGGITDAAQNLVR